jgi:hypothetical protein
VADSKRDPIIDPPRNSSGSPKNVSAGRIKSISGGGPNFTKNADPKTGHAPPSSPYGKG